MTPADFRAGREHLGLTQQQLADHFGRSLAIVGKWERGEVALDPLAARYMELLLLAQSWTK